MAHDDCRESCVVRDQLLPEIAGRTSKASSSSITISTSHEFLGDDLISKDREKPLFTYDTKMQKMMH